MPNCLLGYTNQVVLGQLLASSAEAALPVSNLANSQGSPSQGWQTPAGTTTASVRIDSGNTTTLWRLFGLFRTNLTTAAIWRVRVTNNTDLSSPTLDAGTILAGVVAGFGQAVLALTAAVAGRYCHIEISDAGNPDGFLNIPLAFAGDAWQPISNWSYASTHGLDVQAPVTETRGGQQYARFQFRRRRREPDFGTLRPSEMVTAEALRVQATTGANLLFVPNPTAAGINREAIFGRCELPDDIAYPAASRVTRRMKLKFTERL